MGRQVGDATADVASRPDVCRRARKPCVSYEYIQLRRHLSCDLLEPTRNLRIAILGRQEVVNALEITFEISTRIRDPQPSIP